MSPSLGQRLLRAADRLEEAFMIVALTFMTLLTFVQVVLRYVFETSLVWSLEATTYSFAWLVLVGMSYGVRTNAHIAVDLLTSRLPPRAGRLVAVLALCCGLAYCALMIYGSGQFLDRLMTLGTDARDIPLPRWLLTGIMPIAFLLLALRLVQAARPLFATRDSSSAAAP
ncbi:MAG TPA: TRAP transporter small permease [Gammaproteobacteria bacterium]|nr:TRAP transporter small permease [Gammaproteobacteria bacterium]